jgi:hypothetical protein
MSGGNYTDRGNIFLLTTLEPEDEIFLGIFIITAFWALFSGAVVLQSIQEMAQRSAWRWVTSLAAASVVMAYCFWKLL